MNTSATPETLPEQQPTAAEQPQPATELPTLVDAHSCSTHGNVFSQLASPAFSTFLKNLGKAIHDSRFFGTANDSQGVIIAFDCVVKQMSAIDWAKTYHLIQGKITMRADAMLAKYNEAGGNVEWLNIGDDEIEARGIFRYLDSKKKIEIGYHIEHAKRAKLVKKDSAWEKDPGAMLRARLVSKALRIVAPQVIAGSYTAEDMGESGDNEEQDQPQQRTLQTETRANTSTAEIKVNGKPAASPTVATESKAKAEPQQPKTEKPEPVAPAKSEPKPAAPEPALSTESASHSTPEQLAEFKALRIALDISQDVIVQRLRTHYRVDSPRSLTVDQMDGLLEELRQKKRVKQDQTEVDRWAEGALKPTENKPVDMDDMRPATSEQIEELKSLCADLEIPQQDIIDLVKRQFSKAVPSKCLAREIELVLEDLRAKKLKQLPQEPAPF